MIKKISILVIVLLIASAATISALAGPPQEASGLWQYQSYLVSFRQSGCNFFLTTFETGTWIGTFSGSSTEDGQVVMHCNGDLSFNAIVSFDGEVDNKYGTFEMSVVGRKQAGAADWEGNFVILSGTGELADLRGQGTWWGPGSPGPGQPGDIYYAGNYHFEP